MRIWLSLLLLLGCTNSFATQIDPRTVPISAEQLKALVRSCPLHSREHLTLISRGFAAHQQKFVYALYAHIWQQNPDDAYACLWRGVVAEVYWRYAVHPNVNEIPIGSQKSIDLFQTAQSSLAKAFALDPTSPLIKSEQGYFLVLYGGDQKEGMRLLTEAETAAPKDARIHTFLGDILLIPVPKKIYDGTKAIAELRTAIRLDPSYARPHWLLALVGITARQYDLAQEGVDGFLRRCPPDAVKYVKGFQEDIDAHKKKGTPPLRTGSR